MIVCAVLKVPSPTPMARVDVAGVRKQQIGDSVIIEIGDRDCKGRDLSAETDVFTRCSERPRARAKQEDDAIPTVANDKVLLSIIVEIAHGEGLRRTSHAVLNSGLEGAIALANQHGDEPDRSALRCGEVVIQHGDVLFPVAVEISGYADQRVRTCGVVGGSTETRLGAAADGLGNSCRLA